MKSFFFGTINFDSVVGLLDCWSVSDSCLLWPESFFVAVCLVFVRHGFSLDFSFYFYFYFFYSATGFERRSTLERAFGGISCVFTSFFLDLMSPFSVLCGVLTFSVTWLSEDSTYFSLFLILLSISGPLVLARNLSWSVLSTLLVFKFPTLTIF